MLKTLKCIEKQKSDVSLTDITEKFFEKTNDRLDQKIYFYVHMWL